MTHESEKTGADFGAKRAGKLVVKPKAAVLIGVSIMDGMTRIIGHNQ